MSTPATPHQPQNDSKAASIAWAIAAIVVALVVAFIVWLAMGDRGGSDPVGSEDSPTPTATTDGDATEQEATGAEGETTAADDLTDAQETDGQAAPGETAGESAESAEQSPPPDVEEFMLGLQRRDADDPMAVGDVDAPVVMIEYADYRCPYCAQFVVNTRPELEPLVEDGTLRIEFRDMVLFQETSELAAIAARAAAEQGHLTDFQHELFSLSLDGHGEYDRDDLIELAKEVGVPDIDAFTEALDDEEIRAAVQADTQEARAIGVSSTPTFLVNTQVVQGAYPPQHFQQVIAAELEKAEKTDSR